MQRPLGAQISHMLKDRGVTHIFGIPGVHNQEMYRGIEEAGLVHVLARHEQGAGFMADGYARATGEPGVCYVITGPGLCNIMTPLGQAYSDSVPVLCISSCLDETTLTRGQLHQMKDQRAAGETVCEWSEIAATPAAAYGLVDRAFTACEAGANKPYHIQVPISVLEGEGGLFPDEPSPLLPPLPRPDHVENLAQRLCDADRPLFVFGGGAANEKAAQAALQLSIRCNAAVFTTYAGRGVVQPDYELSFGSYLARPESAEVIAKSDLVVVFGSELSEVDLWRSELSPRKSIVRVDISTDVLAVNSNEQEVVFGDATETLEQLLEVVSPTPQMSPWTPDEIEQTKARWRAQVDAERPGIVPICDALAEVMTPDTMVYSDMTQLAYAAKEVIAMHRPGHWHHPYGFGTLGYALPAAIGGAIARPGLPTICIIGDYGFQYTMAELATAVELKLPLPIILWDNGKLGEIEDSMTRAQIAPNAVIQQNPDFLKLAEAFGAHALGPQTIAEFQQAVRDALGADRPTLIRVTPQIASG